MEMVTATMTTIAYAVDLSWAGTAVSYNNFHECIATLLNSFLTNMQAMQPTCNPSPCQNGGTCTSSGGGGYECSCPTSWRGTNCTVCAVDNCAQCSRLREGCRVCNRGYYLEDTTGQCSEWQYIDATILTFSIH